MYKLSLRKLIVAILIGGIFIAVVYYIDSTNYFLRASLISEDTTDNTDNGAVDQPVDADQQIHDAQKNLNQRKKVFRDMQKKMEKYSDKNLEDLASEYEDSIGELEDLVAEQPDGEDEQQKLGEDLAQTLNDMDDTSDEFYGVIADKNDKITDKKVPFKVAPSTKELEQKIHNNEVELRQFQKTAKDYSDSDLNALTKEMASVFAEAQKVFGREEYDSALSLMTDRWNDMRAKFNQFVSQIQEAIQTKKIQDQLKVIQDELDKKNDLLTQITDNKKVSQKVQKTCAQFLDQKEKYAGQMQDLFDQGQLDDIDALLNKVDQLNKKTDKSCQKVYGKSENFKKAVQTKSSVGSQNLKSAAPKSKPIAPNPIPIAPNPIPIKGQ